MFEHIKFIKIPVMCQGVIVEPTPAESEAKLYVVRVDTDVGTIMRLRTRLCFAPGTETNFKKNDAVMVLVELWYSMAEEKFKEVVHDGKHYILGRNHPINMKPEIPSRNINADLAGGLYKFLHPQNHCGVVVEDNGAVNLVTDGLVNKRMSPRGYGSNEESETTTAQNFKRIVMNQVGQHRAREYFGMYRGGNQGEMSTNAADVSGKKMLIAYKRFIPKSLDPNYWVSTCEGAYSPWIGPNNEVDKMNDGDILFSKVINAKDARITITAGKKGRDFFNIRVDKIVPMSEKMAGKGPECTPPAAFLKSSISINEDGEVAAEFGCDGVNAAAILKITKDGAVTITAKANIKLMTKQFDVVADTISLKAPRIKLDGVVEMTGPVTAKGKNLVTADLLAWMSSNMAILYSSISGTTGGPCIANPAAAAAAAWTQLGTKSSAPGQWQTNPADVAAAEPVVAVAETPPLKST